jgi:pimeloyl-ACP methyl ester carboxylesterase
MVCIHGFTDTWRTWELVLPALQRRHDVLAPTLLGHAGAAERVPAGGEVSDALLLDALERAMDEAGFDTAHIVGNSLGGYLSLKLAERGRARTVTALAPAGGWAAGDESYRETLAHFGTMQQQLRSAAPHAEALLSSIGGRRMVTQLSTTNFEHIPVELLAHQMRGVVACDALAPLVDYALAEGWQLDAQRVACPVRIVWGTADRLLPWPSAAARYRELLPNADWVVLEDIGHLLQLDVPLESAELILGFASP